MRKRKRNRSGQIVLAPERHVRIVMRIRAGETGSAVARSEGVSKQFVHAVWRQYHKISMVAYHRKKR